MNQQLIEYMTYKPSNKQIGILKYLYSSMLKQLEALQQFKADEINKIQSVYNGDSDENLENIINNRPLILESIEKLSNNIYILENYLFKDYVIYTDISENNICPICEHSMALHSLHYVLFNQDKSSIIGRDYAKSCYCDNCKRRYIPKSNYTDIISTHDINSTNIQISKSYCVPDSDIFTVVVVSNTLPCSSKGHKTKDVLAKFPALNENGDLKYIELAASYCFNCNRFTVLKDSFNSIQDRIMCKVIDETSESKTDKPDEIEIEQRSSILFYYGYNVQTKKNISEKQRQIILSSVIEAQLMERRDIINHLTTLIDRGSKIPSWKIATQKWRQDREFVSNYKLGDLPPVIFDKVIKRYTYHKQS